MKATDGICKKVGQPDYGSIGGVYINKHSEADISHGICPDCLRTHYPVLFREMFPTVDGQSGP